MFVYSMRAGTVRFFGVVCIALLLLVTLVAFVPELQPVAAAGEITPSTQSIRYEDVKSAADGAAFLAQFGWEVDPAPTEDTTVTIPAEFDKVFAAYNEMQRAQGLDLSAYSGRVVQRYTFHVTNYEGHEGTVLANLLVSRGRVIGGDICAAEQGGFLHGFQKNT
jgi:hypothetical protein